MPGMTETDYLLPPTRGIAALRYRTHGWLSAGDARTPPPTRTLFALTATAANDALLLRVRTAATPQELPKGWRRLGAAALTQAGYGPIRFALDVAYRTRPFGIESTHTDESVVRQKLREQIEANGARVLHMQGHSLPIAFVRKPGRPSYAPHRIVGAIDVHDPDAFNAYRSAGIGRGRAFGLGLMVLLPY